MSGFAAVLFVAAVVSLGSGQTEGKPPAPKTVPPQAPLPAASPAPAITLESIAQQVNDLKVHDTLSRQLARLQDTLDAQPKPEPRDWRVEIAPWGLLAVIAITYFLTRPKPAADSEELRQLKADIKQLTDKVTELEFAKATVERVEAVTAKHADFLMKVVSDLSTPERRRGGSHETW